MTEKKTKKNWGCFWSVLLSIILACGLFNASFRAHWGATTDGWGVTHWSVRREGPYMGPFLQGVWIGFIFEALTGFAMALGYYSNKLRPPPPPDGMTHDEEAQAKTRARARKVRRRLSDRIIIFRRNRDREPEDRPDGGIRIRLPGEQEEIPPGD